MNDVAPIKQENPLVKLHEQLEQRPKKFRHCGCRTFHGQTKYHLLQLNLSRLQR